jgi:putative ABC transport system substrate-binding protein
MLGQKAAGLAIRILREGTRPGDLPVAIMHSYQVVVNLGAARRAGIQLPLSLLVLADELIDEETPRGR